MVLANSFVSSPWFILVCLLCFFGIIALVVLILRNRLKMNKNDKPKDEKKIAEENLSHYLQDVDDPEAQKQFEEYEKQLKNESKDKKEDK